MASITVAKRRNRWVVDYYVGGDRQVPSFDTKGEAEAYKRELLLRPIDHITGFKRMKMIDLKSASTEYLDRVTVEKAERTFEVDKKVMERLRDHFKNRMLYEITPADVELFRRKLADVLNPATVNRQINVVKNFFKKCVEWSYLRESPAVNISKLPEIPKPKLILTANQINEIIRCLPNWATDAFYFICKTGLRRGQACSLKWEWVDWSTKTFKTISSKGGRIRVQEFPMTGDIHQLFLEKWNLRQRSFKKSEYVLLGEDGEKIKPNSLTQVVVRLREKTGVPNAGLHILRHTLITRLGENNNNGMTIQEIAGHASMEMTKDYFHPAREEMRKSLEDLGERQPIKRKEM
jgi:integrase